MMDNPKDYKSERLLAPGRDGELIPIDYFRQKARAQNANLQ